MTNNLLDGAHAALDTAKDTAATSRAAHEERGVSAAALMTKAASEATAIRTAVDNLPKNRPAPSKGTRR